jgi:hypothetical protein
MPEWIVRLVGAERDLRFLATTLRNPDCRVTEEDGEFHLRSSGFAALSDAGGVKTAADEMIKGANLAALIRFERYGGVLPGEVVGLEPDGSRHVSVFLEAGAVAIAGMAPTVVGSQHTPPPDLSRDMALLKRKPALADALSYLHDEPNWHGCWKAFEAVRKAAGGNRGLKRRGWTAEKPLSRFTHSAQPERHHDCPGPADQMTEAEGRLFVHRLLERWRDEELSRTREGPPPIISAIHAKCFNS